MNWPLYDSILLTQLNRIHSSVMLCVQVVGEKVLGKVGLVIIPLCVAASTLGAATSSCMTASRYAVEWLRILGGGLLVCFGAQGIVCLWEAGTSA